MRLAALLDLSSPTGTVVLGGSFGTVAEAIVASVDVLALLLDGSESRSPHLAEVSAMRGGGRIPLAAESVRAVALDHETADEERLADAVRVLRPGGRLVGPANAPVPNGVTELARDEWQWVAERAAPTVPLLRRAR